jgi:crossover junction endodeoxyribonuclease RuvC
VAFAPEAPGVRLAEVRILGVDPGSRCTGYAVIERRRGELRPVDSGVIRPRAATLAERLSAIHGELVRLIAALRPDGAALEAVFSARNARSALVLGQARGVALAACGQAGIPTAEYAPAQVKSAVAGYGLADKSQVQRMVQRLLGLERPPQSDAADAIAVAICHAQGMRLRTLAAGTAS